MFALPTATAVTRPLLFTVATAVLLLAHVTFLFVALAGRTVAVRVSEPPTTSVIVFLFSVTPVADCVTVTAHVADTLPTTVRTVMIAEPPDTPVTKPLLDTNAIALSLDDQ
jgi:hypothetical protein